MSEENLPVLENWKVTQRPFFAFECVSGDIYNDPKERFCDGTFIYTSGIVELNEENGILQTKNTTYRLGEKVGAE